MPGSGEGVLSEWRESERARNKRIRKTEFDNLHVHAHNPPQHRAGICFLAGELPARCPRGGVGGVGRLERLTGLVREMS